MMGTLRTNVRGFMAATTTTTTLGCLLLLAARLAASVRGQGLPVQYGLLPLGDLTTTDQGGPYAVPAAQAREVEAAIAAKTAAPGGPFTDADVLNFLANTECLEATFNTYAAFSAGLPASLKPGGVNGGRRASLSSEVQSWAEEVALDEQGHVRMIREVLGERSVPCPDLDLSGGFRAYFDAALNTTSSPPFDPFKRDVNFLLATWSLEEIGATGDKGCILLASNPGVSNAIAGLAVTAGYQSGIDRHFLWQRRNETVPEYGKTVHEIVMAVSNIRDTWEGPAETDQGLFNADPNFIAVPTGNINLVPTDVRGLTLSRTPQQVLRIVTLGSPTGRGGFFPRGVNGRIVSPAGFSDAVNARGGWPGNLVVVNSLADANRTALLNANITTVTPAPLPVQAEASGQSYTTTRVPPTPSPAVTLVSASSSPSPAAATAGTKSNASAPSNSTRLESGPASNATRNATAAANQSVGNGTAPNTAPGANATSPSSPLAVGNTTANASALTTSPPAFTATAPAAEGTNASTGAGNATAHPAASGGNGTVGGTPAPVVVVPGANATAPGATAARPGASPTPQAGAANGTEAGVAAGSPAPPPAVPAATATAPETAVSPAPVAANVTAAGVNVAGSPSPAPTDSTAAGGGTTSPPPSPAESGAGTTSSPSPSPAEVTASPSPSPAESGAGTASPSPSPLPAGGGAGTTASPSPSPAENGGSPSPSPSPAGNGAGAASPPPSPAENGAGASPSPSPAGGGPGTGGTADFVTTPNGAAVPPSGGGRRLMQRA